MTEADEAETIEEVFSASTRIVVVVDQLRTEGHEFDFLSTALIDAYVRMSRFFAKKTVSTGAMLRALAKIALAMAEDEDRQDRAAKRKQRTKH